MLPQPAAFFLLLGIIHTYYAIYNSKFSKGIDRKLTGYGVEFTSSGWADNRIYTITAIPNPFKLYAITKLGIPAQADFTKIQNLYFYFFCVDGFADWPMVEMEAILEEDGKKVSPKTISKWLKYLEHLDYVKFSQCDYALLSECLTAGALS